jgi:serine/threonine protein kinase
MQLSPKPSLAGDNPLGSFARPAVDLSGAILEGAYRLVRLIGQGGMGVVYEAVQLRLGKRVAVKIMSREHAANTVSLARFHREAEITSKLGHPHLVNVIDFGTAESGEPYLVMEILDGEDLEMRLQKVGHLPLEAVVRITRQAASALGAAHAQDVVHRDMKPANIFLLHVPGEQEFVKVLDFGISKMKAAGARLTRATAVVGSPIYMSPEQTLGKVDGTDHRADQWALACIAWEMISGRPPFDGEDVSTLFHQINRMDPPPLAHHYPSLKPDVEYVLRKALSKNPDDRYSAIRRFGYALETAAFGRYAERTPVMQIPGEWKEELRNGSGESAESTGLVANPGVSMTPGPTVGAAEIAMPAPAVSEISFVTGEAVSMADPLWRRPRVAALGVAGVLLAVVAALFAFRPSSPVSLTKPAREADLSSPHANVAAAPPPEALPTTAAQVSAPHTPLANLSNHPSKKGKAKLTNKARGTSNAFGAPRHRSAQPKHRPRLIREL